MAVENASAGIGLVEVVALLGVSIVAVPIFRRLGLGSVLGYFAAGLICGPFALSLADEPEAVLHFAEFGVIMLLFIIGLEMQPSRLWALRKAIFGLGIAQVAVCGGLLTLAAMGLGLDWRAAFIAGMGFVLSSTAVIMQMLEERGETGTPAGQRAVSVLLLEDLSIVPLLAAVALLAPGTAEDAADPLATALVAVACIGGLILAGRYLLNPLFGVLARVHAREMMTAAALFVVLGSALLMEFGGLSMAMGAFLAGVLLSESSFRRQLETDIEPFRGILLGLFFLAVGMSLDLAVIAREWLFIIGGLLAFVAVKGIGIYLVAKAFGSGNHEAITRVALFAQGGEFAFVLYSAATAAGIMDSETNAAFTAIVILSMALTPIVNIALKRLTPPPKVSTEGVETPDGLSSRVLIIGFGRFAQVASQPLLARGIEVTIIETDVEMIQAASTFGFKVYYGDGTRLDILEASGVRGAEAVLVCVNDEEACDKIAKLMAEEFPLVKVFARAYDRGHALRLVHAGVEYQIRETLESAMSFGEAVLRSFGTEEDAIADIMEDVRRRDEERFDLQLASDIYAGRDLMRGNAPVPAPLTRPKGQGAILGPDNKPPSSPVPQRAKADVPREPA